VQSYCVEGQATNGTTIGRMRLTYRISNATDTHSEYAISIAFLLQKKKFFIANVAFGGEQKSKEASKSNLSLICNYISHENGDCIF
jgi:hypothetical protein